jgi:carbon-monoxide dehydrogenase small subunit
VTTTGWNVAAKIDTDDGHRGRSTGLIPLPARIDGGITLSRAVFVPVPVDRLWTTLQDIDAVAKCLPGASIEEFREDGSVLGAFAVAIGPMRARFTGAAQVSYDVASCSGTVRGAGGDGISRSRADGVIEFRALAAGNQGSKLDIDMTYKLSGPLSQFGRPAVVSHVVDVLLGDFAKNLALASEGETVIASAPVGGGGLVLGTLLAMLRRLFFNDRT